MQALIASLEKLGLAKSEALVYIDILQNPVSNGSQITSRINLPKPSVYLALDKLYRKGIINLIPGKSKQYIAQDPVVALEQLRKDYNASIDNTLLEIKNLNYRQSYDEFIHIQGYANFSGQLLSMINNSQKELYLHGNIDLNQFRTELVNALERGVRIINYSFGTKYDYSFLSEDFHDDKLTSKSFRLLMVADYQECLMAEGALNQDYLAIYTRNMFQVGLIAENIHNAIYWLKLYQQNPDFTYPCRMETLAERDIHPSGYMI